MKTKTRTKDGVEEHRHEDLDYWHPIARIHTGAFKRMPFRIDHIYDVDDDGVYDIIEAMTITQSSYIDERGELHDLLEPGEIHNRLDGVRDISKLDTLSLDWAIAVSEVLYIKTQVTYQAGSVDAIRLSSSCGSVEFRGGRVHYDQGTDLHDAKLLLETGLAAKYIAHPTLSEAMHLMHVSGGDRHFDLIRLPSGGHIPVDILEAEYEVSWETIAKIPLGLPRNDETFTCPICCKTSYYAGVCSHCDDICTESQLEEFEDMRALRKEHEHGEILRMIKVGNVSSCRYMRG